MLLNQRQRRMLQSLITFNDFIPVHELADRYRVSDRSIRSDLQAIDYYLNQNGRELDRHKRLGVRLLVQEKDQETWMQDVFEETNYTNRLSAKERHDTIAGVLFRKQEPVSSTTLSKLLHVSRRTVVEDMKSVKEWLEQRHLILEYVRNKGFRISGKEQDIRQTMAELASKQSHNLTHFSKKMTGLSADELAYIRKAVVAQIQNLPYELVDSARDGLVFHIAVSIQRLRKGHNIAMPPKELSELKAVNEFSISLSIGKEMTSKFHLHVPDAEIGYMTLHLLGAKMLAKEESATVLTSEPSETAVQQFIKEVSARLGTDLSADKQLRRGLIVHLRPTLYRLQYNLRLENPMKEEIMQQYNELVDSINRGVHLLERAFSVSFNDDECAYIALHFGAALERQAAAVPYKPRVLLVCGSGIGTTQLLLTRMKRYFPDLEIVDTYPLYQVSDKLLKQREIDWVISTVPLQNKQIPHIIVNPLLTVHDREQIASLIYQERENITKEGGNGPVLKEVLTPELIRLDVEASDWEEAIRSAGQLLIDQDKAEPRYVDTIVQIVKNNGPYIVIDKGIAMPHAHPEDGVKSLGFSLIRLKEPIPFGHDRNDPVKVVLCLGTVDAEVHLNALRQFQKILNEKENHNVLMTGDKSAILNKIQEISNI